jgi:hypothetical protein
MTSNRRVNGDENENEERQRAAALQNLAEARRASNRAKRLGVRCPRTAFFGCVRLPKEHSIVTERSHPRKAAPFWSTFAGARSVRWLLGGVIKVQASFNA